MLLVVGCGLGNGVGEHRGVVVVALQIGHLKIYNSYLAVCGDPGVEG